MKTENSVIRKMPYDERDSPNKAWLSRINKLIEYWGMDYVPGDIKPMVNKVEAGLNLPLTQW